MDQSASITASFNSLWNSSGLPTLAAGGLQWSKEHMKTPTVRPYAQVWCKLYGKPSWTSGLSYVQRYAVECTVWCGDDNTQLKTIDQALNNLINVSTKLETLGFLTESSQTVHIELDPAGLDQEEQRANQQNVGVVRHSWLITLNQTRTSP